MNKIPLSVSSTLTNVRPSTPVVATAYANNTGKTGAAAPVLITVESEETVDAAAFAEAMPDKGGQGTAAQARLVINSIAEVLSDLVAEYGAVTVGTPFGRVDTFVAGSLEYATDPVDPLVNVPYLGIVPGADVMKEFAKIEAYVPTAACSASLKRVRDVATGDHAIHGGNSFYAQGYGMTYGGTGETVKLLNPLTRAEVCTVSVDAATKSKAQLKCTLPTTTAIAAGVYILQVTTLAGGTSTLWPLEIKVNLAEAVTPTVTPIYTSTLGGLKVWTGADSHEHTLPTGPVTVSATTDTLVVTGKNLVPTSESAPTTGITDVFVQNVTGDNIPVTPVYDAANNKMTLPLGTALASVAAGTYENAKITCFCYTDGQEDTLTIAVPIVKG